MGYFPGGGGTHDYIPKLAWTIADKIYDKLLPYTDHICIQFCGGCTVLHCVCVCTQLGISYSVIAIES